MFDKTVGLTGHGMLSTCNHGLHLLVAAVIRGLHTQPAAVRQSVSTLAPCLPRTHSTNTAPPLPRPLHTDTAVPRPRPRQWATLPKVGGECMHCIH